MEQFIASCSKESTMRSQINDETGRQDDVDVTTGTLEEGGASGLIQDQGEGIVDQPVETSTPKKNTRDPPTPAVVQRDTGAKGVSGGGDGQQPEKGMPAWILGEGPEEIAELCLPEVQPRPEDEAGVGDQDQEEEVEGPEEIAELCLPEVQPRPEDEAGGGDRDQEEVDSVAGDLMGVDDSASWRMSSDNEKMSSLNEMMSSLNSVIDTSIANTESIKKAQEIHKKQCRKSNMQHSKSMDENMTLRNEQDVQRKLLGSLTAKVFKLSQKLESVQPDKKVANRGVEAWKIPYEDLKRNGQVSTSSQPLLTLSGGNFQATLYLNGMKEGTGTHVSLVISKTNQNTFKYKCIVQVVSLGNKNGSIRKEGNFQMGVTGATSHEKMIEFHQLVPIGLLEEPSQFLVNGILLIVLTFKELSLS